MPKINVYLPDDLAAAVRQAGLSVSPICQKALAEAVRAVSAAREVIEALSDPELDLREPQLSARIASRMTPRLQQVLGRARDLAGPDRPVETEHLLVAVIDEPANLGAQVLKSLAIDVAGLRDAAARAGDVSRPESAAPRQRGEAALGGLSTTARLAIASALEAAIDLGHDFVGCEHLVLGLAEQSGGTAATLLRDLGITPESVRRAIPLALAGATLGQRNASVDAGRLDHIDRRLDEIEQRLRARGF